MTTKTHEERLAQEMQRGQQIAQRAQRESDLQRFIAAKKVKVMVALPGHALYERTGRVNLFEVDGVRVASQNEQEDDYPSVTVMAFIQMAVSATVGYDGIQDAQTIDPETRRRRDEYRTQMGRNLARSEGNA